jgi:hypothetical protein
MSTSFQLPTEIEKLIGEWFLSWELGPPPDKLRIEFSNRLKRSLGRCRPERREIRLAARLLDGPTAFASCLEDGLDGTLLIERADG